EGSGAAPVGRIIGAPIAAAGGVVERRGELEVEIGPDAEHEADHGGNRKRNHEAGSVHRCDPRGYLAEAARQFKRLRLAADFQIMQLRANEHEPDEGRWRKSPRPRCASSLPTATA